MALDTLEQQSINIKDITLEAKPQKPSRDFDTELGISENDWQKTIHYDIQPDRFEDNYYLEGFIQSMGFIKALHPVLPPGFELRDDEINKCKDFLSIPDTPSEEEIQEALMIMIGLKLSSPEKLKELKDDVPNSETIFNIISNIKGRVPLFELMAAKIVFPEEFEKFEFDKEMFWEAEKDFLEKLSANEDFEMYSNYAGRAKIVFQKEFENFKISNKMLEKMTQQIKGRKDFQYEDIEHIFYLKVLLAKDIKIDDNGIEFVMDNTDLNKPAQPIPERRKF